MTTTSVISTPEIRTLGPREEADRLWKGAQEAFEQAEESFVRLCEALDLGLRAIEILAVLRLQPVRPELPASIAMLLESPEPEVDVTRDGIHVPNSLSFVHVVDMLSDDGLDCVSPKLHHGWEDRRHSCLRSRKLARETTGVSLGREDRDHLLLLQAYRNRIFRLPPPVKIVPGDIVVAFPAAARLYERLSASMA
ncbi:MAG: hypothetical protein GY719_22855 [bacterium]|nr:hypothetical protein [bacterium]